MMESKTGLARALSKLGYCSRTQARVLIESERVRVNGKLARDPEQSVQLGKDRIEVDGRSVQSQERIYLMLNKPRGLVTTVADERGRATVFSCLSGLPRVVPVGRLDKASEGLLLFTNDTAWAARMTDPATHLDKTYHVQVDCLGDDELTRKLVEGLTCEGEFLAAKRATVLRSGGKNSWLEIVLDEGKNRHIRRLLGELGIEVLRLIRVAVGTLALGELPKGQYRVLTSKEAVSLCTA